MPRYRNIRVKMKGGKVRIQRALVLASGKLRFVKGKGRSSPRKSGGKKRSGRKSGFVFTKARRAALAKAQRASRRGKRRGGGKRRSRGRARRRSGGGSGGLSFG